MSETMTFRVEQIGVRDLMYGGDFITVLDDDTEESIT